MHHRDLENQVARFVEANVVPDRLSLIGVSGGVDSTALLHLLLFCSKQLGLRFHVVHIDHGWRKESAAEAVTVEKRVQELGFPFSCFRLIPCPEGENIEDWSRRQRLECFKKAGSALGTDSVFLAHQADDQTEVVLKRFLEGSSVMKFRGMRAVERSESLTILRPLLFVRRSTLLSYLNDLSLPYLLDPSNHDLSFLRPRLRDVVFPFLRTNFGKEFDDSLLRISHEASDLEEFISEEVGRRFSFHVAEGCAFAEAREEHSSPFLARCCIDVLKERLSLSAFSRSQVEGAVNVFCGPADEARSFFIGDSCLFAEKGFFAAFCHKPSPVPKVEIKEEQGALTVGEWHISWRPATEESSKKGGWKELFSGTPVSLRIPNLPFTISRANEAMLRLVKRSGAPTARFVSLRPFLPVVSQGFRLVADSISGYTIPLPPGNQFLAVTIRKAKTDERVKR